MYKPPENEHSLELAVTLNEQAKTHSFTKVPNKLIYSSLPPVAKAVYALIQQRADVTRKVAHFSERGLATHTGLCPKTIRRALKLLRQTNVLLRRSRGGKAHPRALAGRASEYVVNPPEQWRLGRYSPRYTDENRAGGAS